MRFFQFLTESNDEAQYRRDDREWELGPNCPEEGLKAHALLKWLKDNGDVNVRTPEQTERLNFLKNRLEELGDSEGEEVDDEVQKIENEIDELEDAIDVYDIIPNGKHFYMDEFEVPEVLGGRRYAVGTTDETRISAEDAVRSLIYDLGLDAFNKTFAKNHLDTDKIEDEARDYYEQDVYDNPDVYLSDEDRDLSDRQEQEIAILYKKIKQANDAVEYLKTIEGTEEKINELTNLIDDLEIEITDIEENPDGEYNQTKMDEKVDDLVSNVGNYPENFLEDFGLDWRDFVDLDAIIEDAIDSDGEAHFINSYDGTSDEIEVQGEIFVVMRID